MRYEQNGQAEQVAHVKGQCTAPAWIEKEKTPGSNIFFMLKGGRGDKIL